MKQVVLSNESWISLNLPKRNGGHSSVYSQKKIGEQIPRKKGEVIARE